MSLTVPVPTPKKPIRVAGEVWPVVPTELEPWAAERELNRATPGIFVAGGAGVPVYNPVTDTYEVGTHGWHHHVHMGHIQEIDGTLAIRGNAKSQRWVRWAPVIVAVFSALIAIAGPDILESAALTFVVVQALVGTLLLLVGWMAWTRYRRQR